MSCRGLKKTTTLWSVNTNKFAGELFIVADLYYGINILLASPWCRSKCLYYACKKWRNGSMAWTPRKMAALAECSAPPRSESTQRRHQQLCGTTQGLQASLMGAAMTRFTKCCVGTTGGPKCLTDFFTGAGCHTQDGTCACVPPPILSRYCYRTSFITENLVLSQIFEVRGGAQN